MPNNKNPKKSGPIGPGYKMMDAEPMSAPPERMKMSMTHGKNPMMKSMSVSECAKVREG